MLSDPSGPLRDLLAAVIGRYEQDDVSDVEALPERCWVAHGVPGQIAADEPDPMQPMGSLMASMTRLQVTSQPSQGIKAPVLGVQITHSAVYQIRLLRPSVTITSPGAPDPATVSEHALILARDSTRLMDALHAWDESLPPWLTAGIGQVEPEGPSGGVAGWRITATLGPL